MEWLPFNNLTWAGTTLYWLVVWITLTLWIERQPVHAGDQNGGEPTYYVSKASWKRVQFLCVLWPVTLIGYVLVLLGRVGQWIVRSRKEKTNG